MKNSFEKLFFIVLKVQSIFDECKRFLLERSLKSIGKGSYVSSRQIEIDSPKNLLLKDNSVIGKNAKILCKTGEIVIGNSVYINNDVILYSVNSRINIKNNCYINHHVELLANHANITIGNDVSIGMNVLITTSNHGFAERNVPIMQQKEEYKAVYIKNGAWIGANCIILPGVIIGEGAVIGAGSVATKNVEKYTIVCGAQARFIKKRV